jgi:hypothetical protein
MSPPPSWRFGPFRLDTGSGSLWWNETLMPLRPKPWQDHGGDAFVAGVSEHLTQRFGEKSYPRELEPLLHKRTEGNPLFLVTLVDDVLRRGILREGADVVELEGGVESVATGVPENLRHLIEQQLEQLDPAHQELLGTASVAGVVFSAAMVAAGIDASGADAVAAVLSGPAGRGRKTLGSGRRGAALGN